METQADTIWLFVFSLQFDKLSMLPYMHTVYLLVQWIFFHFVDVFVSAVKIIHFFGAIVSAVKIIHLVGVFVSAVNILPLRWCVC